MPHSGEIMEGQPASADGLRKKDRDTEGRIGVDLMDKLRAANQDLTDANYTVEAEELSQNNRKNNKKLVTEKDCERLEFLRQFVSSRMEARDAAEAKLRKWRDLYVQLPPKEKADTGAGIQPKRGRDEEEPTSAKRQKKGEEEAANAEGTISRKADLGSPSKVASVDSTVAPSVAVKDVSSLGSSSNVASVDSTILPKPDLLKCEAILADWMESVYLVKFGKEKEETLTLAHENAASAISKKIAQINLTMWTSELQGSIERNDHLLSELKTINAGIPEPKEIKQEALTKSNITWNVLQYIIDLEEMQKEEKTTKTNGRRAKAIAKAIAIPYGPIRTPSVYVAGQILLLTCPVFVGKTRKIRRSAQIIATEIQTMASLTPLIMPPGFEETFSNCTYNNKEGPNAHIWMARQVLPLCLDWADEILEWNLGGLRVTKVVTDPTGYFLTFHSTMTQDDFMGLQGCTHHAYKELVKLTFKGYSLCNAVFFSGITPKPKASTPKYTNTKAQFKARKGKGGIPKWQTNKWEDKA